MRRGHRRRRGGCRSLRRSRVASVLVGLEGDDHLVIRMLDWSDDGWGRAEVSASASLWRGTICGNFYRGELSLLAAELERLYTRLEGETIFDPMEHLLRIRVLADGKGHFRWEVVLQEVYVDAPRLEFKLQLDQTELPAIISGLRAMDAG
jgi:hypothetical protein